MTVRMCCSNLRMSTPPYSGCLFALAAYYRGRSLLLPLRIGALTCSKGSFSVGARARAVVVCYVYCRSALV